MRILILTSKFPRYKNDPQPGFVYYLAREYVKQGIDVTVLAPHHPGAKSKENFEGIDIHRFKYFLPSRFEKFAYGAGIPANVQSSHLARFQAPLFMLAQIFSTIILAKKLKPDMIHVNWAFPQGIAARISGYPYIMTIYGGEVFLTRKLHLVKIMDYLINKSKKSFSITNGLLEVMREFGFKSNKISILPLGLDPETFHPGIAGYEEIKKKYLHAPLVLNVSRLVEKKGHVYLIQAFKKVIKEVPSAKLLIIGDGNLKDSLKSEITKLGLDKNVFLLGEIGHEELPKYYCAADLFVLPSIIDSIGDRETQGVVLCEAMACKCPVIGTKTGGIPDVISSKEVGILVPEKDSNALADKIILLLKDKKLQDKYAENAYNYCMKTFRWNEIAKKYIDNIQVLK